MGTGHDYSNLGELKFITGTQANNTLQIHKPTICIGRESGNDIIIPDATVSRKHAELSWQNGSWSIKNVSQQSVLTINGRPIPNGQVATLSEGDTIRLGQDTTCRLVSLSSPLFPKVDDMVGTQRASSSQLSLPT